MTEHQQQLARIHNNNVMDLAADADYIYGPMESDELDDARLPNLPIATQKVHFVPPFRRSEAAWWAVWTGIFLAMVLVGLREEVHHVFIIGPVLGFGLMAFRLGREF